MQIETQYVYEKRWTPTNEADLLQIIKEELGDADPEGALLYIKEAIKSGKVITAGSCRFRVQNRGEESVK